jgi:hypothetical protein
MILGIEIGMVIAGVGIVGICLLVAYGIAAAGRAGSTAERFPALESEPRDLCPTKSWAAPPAEAGPGPPPGVANSDSAPTLPQAIQALRPVAQPRGKPAAWLRGSSAVAGLLAVLGGAALWWASSASQKENRPAAGAVSQQAASADQAPELPAFLVPLPVELHVPLFPEPLRLRPEPAPFGVVQPRQTLRLGVNGFAHALRFTSDSKTLLAAGSGGTVRRWDTATGKEGTPLRAHPNGSILSLSLNADGKRLATGSIDSTAKLWDLEAGKELAVFPGHKGPIHVGLSPDGNSLATGCETVRLWDATGKQTATFRGLRAWIDAVVISPDGKRLAAGCGDKTVKVWELATHKELATLRGHAQVVMALAFSPDGKMLASASADRTLKLWELSTADVRLTLRGHEDPLSAVAFSPDGKRLVSGAGAIRFNPGRRGEVKLWDVATGKELAALRGHTDGVSAVAHAADGKTVASASRDGTLKLWDVSGVRP